MELNDFTPWGLVALLVINFVALFKMLAPQMWNDLAAKFQHDAATKSDLQEHAQELEEVLVNAKLQTRAADQLHVYALQEKLVELLEENLAWMRDRFDREFVSFNSRLSGIEAELNGIRGRLNGYINEE